MPQQSKDSATSVGETAQEDTTLVGSEDLSSICDQPPFVVPATLPADKDCINGDKESLKVLIIDDDPLTRKLAGRMLSRLGSTVQTAEDGQQGLDILLGVLESHAPQSFDCVFMDNQMPRRTGLEAVRILRERNRNDLIIGCTGNALQEDQDAFLLAGVDEVLTKPSNSVSFLGTGR